MRAGWIGSASERSSAASRSTAAATAACRSATHADQSGLRGCRSQRGLHAVEHRGQVAGRGGGELGVPGDLAGGVGEVHDLRAGGAPSLPPKTP